MTGNLANAALAMHDYHASIDDNVLSYDGGTRRVYLIDNVVYKIDLGDGRTNEWEYNNIKNTILPTGFLFPETALYYVDDVVPVIAMECIEGQPMCECYCTQDEECDDDCMPDDVKAVMHVLKLDSGGYNVIHNDAGYWIIDAG